MIDLDEYRVRKAVVSAELFRSANDALSLINDVWDTLQEAKAFQPALPAADRALGEEYVRVLIGGAKMTDESLQAKVKFAPLLSSSARIIPKLDMIVWKRERLYHEGYANILVSAHGKRSPEISLEDFVKDAEPLQQKIYAFISARNTPMQIKCGYLHNMWNAAAFSDQETPPEFRAEGRELVKFRKVITREEAGMKRFAAALEKFTPLPPGV